MAIRQQNPKFGGWLQISVSLEDLSSTPIRSFTSMNLISAFALMLVIPQSPTASAWLDSPRGWKGLVPLEATRAEVSRVLGTPDHSDNTYESDNATISFFYSFGPCELAEDSQRWDVPLDVVVAIRVWPKDHPTVSSVELRARGYEQLEIGLPGAVEYKNAMLGANVTTLGGRIQVITFGPTSDEEHHRCAKGPGPAITYPRGEPMCVDIETDADVVKAGTNVQLTALCSEPNRDVLTYRWLVPGGHIVGAGSTVLWDTSGLAPGEYKVVLKVPMRPNIDVERTRRIRIE